MKTEAKLLVLAEYLRNWIRDGDVLFHFQTKVFCYIDKWSIDICPPSTPVQWQESPTEFRAVGQVQVIFESHSQLMKYPHFGFPQLVKLVADPTY